MRKLSYVSGFGAAFFLSISLLFRYHHWPWRSALYLIGIVCLIVASTTALITARRHISRKPVLYKVRIITGYVGCLFIVSGSIFKMLQFVPANIQLVVGTFLLIFVFLPLYVYELYYDNMVLEQKVMERTKELSAALDDLTSAQSQLLIAHEQSEQARKKSDELLLNILPAEVAEELKTNGSSSARQFDNVTVMFTDFVNFTTAGETMGPYELIRELDICFKAFDEIIVKHNIEKIKTIGDAYLAVSGLPIPGAHHATQMISAAMEIAEFMRLRRIDKREQTFDLRIGVHSGVVIAGIVGIKKFAYDIWGDAVNTAARMEQSGVPGRINISQATFDLVCDTFQCTYRGEISAKNKGNLKMYLVDKALTPLL